MEEKPYIAQPQYLETLKEAVNKDAPEIILITGQEGVGKTRLVKELSKQTNVDLFLVFAQATNKYNLEHLTIPLQQKYNLTDFSPENFVQALAPVPEKSVIVFDSYTNNLTTEIIELIEQVIKPKNLKLIITVEENKLDTKLSSLATQVIKLKPLPINNLKQWFTEKITPEDLFKTHFISGGVPGFLEYLSQPISESVQQQFFNKTGQLGLIGKLMLKEKFPNSNIMPQVLAVITSGVHEASGIAIKAGLKQNEVSKYLAILVEEGLVVKQYPVMGGGKKDVRFYPVDSFLAFWARFVWPYFEEINSNLSQNARKSFDQEFPNFASLFFIPAVSEIIQNRPDLLPLPFTKLGRQWGKLPKTSGNSREGVDKYKIALLAVNENNKTIVACDITWQENVDGQNLGKELLEKLQHVDTLGFQENIPLVIFARSFTNKVAEVEGRQVWCIDLAELFTRL